MPPTPVQVSANVVATVTMIDAEPDAAREPVQPPEAAHETASVDDQVSVVLPPFGGTVVGFADRDTVGAGGGGCCTATVA